MALPDTALTVTVYVPAGVPVVVVVVLDELQPCRNKISPEESTQEQSHQPAAAAIATQAYAEQRQSGHWKPACVERHSLCPHAASRSWWSRVPWY